MPSESSRFVRPSPSRRFRIDFRSNKEAWNVRRQVDFNTEVENTLDPITITSTSYTAADAELILVDDDTAGSTVTVTMPAAATSTGKNYHIKKLGSTAPVVVDGNGSDLIDGSLTMTMVGQYDCMELCCDGTGWQII